MGIGSDLIKAQLTYDMLKLANENTVTADIQIGILKDTWLEKFEEEIPIHLDFMIKNIKKAIHNG